MNRKQTRKAQLKWLDSHCIVDKDKKRKSKKLRKPPAPTDKKSVNRFSEEEVDMELDLHGRAVDEAMLEVESCLKALQKSGYSRLRIIHGLHKTGQAAIYSQLRRNLQKEWKHLVQTSYQEPYNPGATILVIKAQTGS